MPVSATAPEDVIGLLAAALHEGRVDDALSLYEDDAVFVAQPDAPPISGREAIREALAGMAAMRPTMTADVRKVVNAGTVATVLNTWHLHGTGRHGESVMMSGISADVMRRRPDGSWRILIDDPWGPAGPPRPTSNSPRKT
jgi:uncharacterized protein (TIGR02246 family)